jgi:TolB-like protein
MDTLTKGSVFLFEGFRLDRQARALFRRDEAGAFVPIVVGSRALEVLVVLVERAGDLISRDEMIAAAWPATVVGDNNLNMQIAALRRILDEGRADGSCIQTMPGRGYRFVVPVTRGDVYRNSDAPGVAAASPRAPPRLSIVVLPFTNLSGDREQEYFVDGITDDLTTDFSRIAGMFVISRNTAFSYKDNKVNTAQIGRELGVRYILEGSLRCSGNQIRVNAQLIDAETDAHLWAERFDNKASDLFTLQDEITNRIAITLNLELIGAEAKRPTAHPEALDYILRGRATQFRPNSRELCAEAISFYERALTLDTGSVEAQTNLAGVLVGRVIDLMTDTPRADLVRAEELISQALAAQPRHAKAHLFKGRVLRAQNRWDEAVLEFETALKLDRNQVWGLHYLAQCRMLTGSIEEAIVLEQRAIRLSPREPRIGWWYMVIGTAHLLQSRTDDAILWLEKARSDLPAAVDVRSRLAAAYALRGETARAAIELGEVRKLSGEDLFSSIACLRAGGVYSGWGVPKTRALFEATYFAGLRLAGMPEG